MIQANCRARFTAADFQFIVRTLARSPNDQVSLVDLLSDAETRDAVLDHPRLVEAILSHAGHLSISSSFYFYVLARHVLQTGRYHRPQALGLHRLAARDFFPRQWPARAPFRGGCRPPISLRHVDRADPGQRERKVFCSARMSATTRFSSAEFSTRTPSIAAGAARPTWSFTRKLAGPISSWWPAHSTARRCELNDVFEELADRFHDVRLALNRLSDELLNLDDDHRASLLL